MPHIHEKIDLTITVFVVYKDKVLLRKHDKYDIWLGVGGHIELDEDPNQAAIREVKEEVGLDIKLITSKKLPLQSEPRYKELIPPEFLNIHSINDTHRHCDMNFFAVADSDQVVPENAHDVWEWFTLKSLENSKYNLRKEMVFYAKEALKLAASHQ